MRFVYVQYPTGSLSEVRYVNSCLKVKIINIIYFITAVIITTVTKLQKFF